MVRRERVVAKNTCNKSLASVPLRISGERISGVVPGGEVRVRVGVDMAKCEDPVSKTCWG
jgi:hypothetical protein